jgi:putative hydrolase of the HAD superfamily
MSTVLVFDLDDTLYDESEFFLSGIRAVSEQLSSLTGKSSSEIFHRAVALVEGDGREKILDRLLVEFYYFNSINLRHMLRVYRSHAPKIVMQPEDLETLQILMEYYPLYLVTDGNKFVQKNKINALGIEKFFRRIFITHRFGLQASKPSLYCFNKIRMLEEVDWNRLTYVGDDPSKDFVGLNSVGGQTIRIRRGRFSHFQAQERFDAQKQIIKIQELLEFFEVGGQ